MFRWGSAASNSLFIEQLEAARDISRAMQYLHQKRIIFRDLKPGNVGFSPPGIVKLFDFGLARELSEDFRTSTIANSKIGNRLGCIQEG